MAPAVLITGGAKRIGAAIARCFGANGWHVLVHYRNSKEEAQSLAASLPSAETVCCNLEDWEECAAMVEALARRLEDWPVLVNSAAVFRFDSSSAIDPAAFDEAMRVDAGTPVRMAQAFLAHARARNGRRVIQLTDQKLANPNPDFFSYTMSKHAVASAVRMLAMACRGGGDRIYAIAPGAILASHDQSELETERSHRMNLLRRKTTPEEIAEAVLFLSRGWLASGETLFVDSGQHLLTQPRDVLFLARE